MSLIEVNNAEVYYGPIRAVKGVSFRVERGEIVALIGANGAGKTTVLHAMSGLLPVRGGEIFYNGHNLLKMPAHKIVRLGLTQVPEGRRVFSELTVKDNLLLGAYTRKNKKEIKETLEYVFALFPRLSERVSQAAGTLSGGEQQMLAVGRALMSKPETLLLDEPSMGLSPLYVNVIFDTIKKINEQGTTVLLVEQNAKKALSVASRAYVLETGSVVREGTGNELLNDPAIQAAYLGQQASPVS